MRHVLPFITLALLATAAHAADPTTSVLEAPYVQDYITLSLGAENGGKTIVKYTLDTNTSPRAANGSIFRSDGEIAIRLQGLNPLTQAWVVKDTATPDLSFAAITGFLNDLKALQASLPQPAETTSAAAARAAGFAPPVVACEKQSGCERLTCRIKDVYDLLVKKELESNKLKEIVSGASGFNGVKDASTRLSERQDEIEKDNRNARTTLTVIRTEFGSLAGQVPLTCDPVTSQLLVDYVQVQGTAEQIIAKKEALHKQLGDLVATLQPFLKGNNWRGPSSSDYEIRTVNPTFAEQRAVEVTAKDRTVQLVDGGIVVKTDDANVITAKFDVRRNSFFVAERAAAVIYNNLTYPQYGTATDAAGKTIVKRNKDHDPIGGALMLNLVMRQGMGGSVAYPLLQFGVSSAKEFPGFLAGVGLRFVEPFNFSFSAGGMITRYKDLDGELKIGDPVSGTADINKHLVYKTSPVALYAAMQLKF